MGWIKRHDDVAGDASAQREPPLWRLVYVSDARTPVSDDDLDHILQTARIRNFFEMDATGMLMLVRGSFCQILEGSADNLNRLFEIIKRDPRHSNVRLLEMKPIGGRSFPDWTMGPPSRSLREFAEAADVEEFFDSVRERTLRPAPDVMTLMSRFHAGDPI